MNWKFLVMSSVFAGTTVTLGRLNNRFLRNGLTCQNFLARAFVTHLPVSQNIVRRQRHSINTRLFSTTNSTSSTRTDADRLEKQKQKAAKAAAAKERRRKFIGLAKAVDRGQFATTYQPGGPTGDMFEAKSGLPPRKDDFIVLGIESSCDDTGAAVVRSDGVILGEALASQSHIHEEWGGVVPGLAKTAHEEALDRVIQTALDEAGTTLHDVDAIGVTVGPGLEICLRVGAQRACELAQEYNKPFVGIHHLEAHIMMARLENRELEWPFLSLLVSGGHCQILSCHGVGNYSILGGTLDDSLGECFDKTARLLGLPVGGGGGPAVEALAKEGDPTAIPLTIPLLKRKDCDFSYAGLKTNVRRAAEQLAMERGVESALELSRQDKANIAASFQNIAIVHLEQRLERAMTLVEKQDKAIRTLALVGGVAANQELRSRLNVLCEARGWTMVVPPPRLCTDQGAMAAWAAIERLKLGSSDDPSNQEVYARYPFSMA
ncbi:DNA-binding/iron metalloprotein/AP endonuclease [Nitzschia inconspicua]|uniref:DNA-binding/iron metalloprotein/AP endonuclease n=1 Tax=Nitzschia inconspicua TaxID=303405 RepID=A0A9K3KW42_9STRA|nr:DNA-binding/iron metalloprotein/AP endonuclease [Nitzschia inconspicua]